jgi:Obg family GTPase CgtA-like protein
VGVSPLFISASTGEGVSGLLRDTLRLLDETEIRSNTVAEEGEKVYQPLPRYTGPLVRKEGDTFIVEAPQLARITGRGGNEEEVRRYVMRRLERQGIDKVLRRLGIRPGSRVRCGSLEWEWS